LLLLIAARIQQQHASDSALRKSRATKIPLSE
jgi:hypothetical protein